MNNLEPMNPNDDLSKLSDEQIRERLAQGLTMTAQGLYRLSEVWAEAERRKLDLSDLRKGLAEFLPRIAAKHLAAEAVVAFAGRPLLLHALEGLPLQRQRELAAGAPIEVLDLTTKNSTLMLPLAKLPMAAVRMVFDGGIIRTPAQQRLALRPRKERSQKTARLFKPQYEKSEGIVRVGKMAVKVADLIQELSAAAGPELPSLLHAEEYVVLRVRLAKEELLKLQDAAAKAELPDNEMARKAMRAFGLI